MALTDLVAALAEAAATDDWCRPEVDAGGRLEIEGGRHPVVERAVARERFVPNDTSLEAGARAIAVLTGPNMGGKSTYLRQVALIALLAQTGSFVPARRARVGVADRIFCRVGASDDLAQNQSTFMVEMTETANILHHASSRSLVLLDEIGRGTSTFDGLSIAWAVVEHLDALAGGAPRTLFATHYHELTELEAELRSVVNLRMAVRESGEDVTFLHRVERGASDRSWGLHVARLAGVPAAVVARAREILANIESDEYGGDGLPRRARTRRRTGPAQPTLFESSPAGPAPLGPPPAAGATAVIEALERIDPDGLTPLEALNVLAELKSKL
jgi:DNA mismatch repair protein MutS